MGDSCADNMGSLAMAIDGQAAIDKFCNCSRGSDGAEQVVGFKIGCSTAVALGHDERWVSV